MRFGLSAFTLATAMCVMPAATAATFSVGPNASCTHNTLQAALDSAANNSGADVDELKVATITVDEGPILKRFMARAKGRGTQIFKRTSHIAVVVGSGKKG